MFLVEPTLSAIYLSSSSFARGSDFKQVVSDVQTYIVPLTVSSWTLLAPTALVTHRCVATGYQSLFINVVNFLFTMHQIINFRVSSKISKDIEPEVCPSCNMLHCDLENHLCQALSVVELRSRLEEGNTRYIHGFMQPHPHNDKSRRSTLIAGQQPAVAVVTCADSRCAPNTVMDAIEGEMFVCRVAGNYVDTSVAGSIQFACQHLGTRMVMICGHTKCGAIQAASEFQDPGQRHGELPLVSMIRKMKGALEDGNSFGPYLNKDECDDKLRQFQDTFGRDLISANVVEQMGIMKHVLEEVPGVAITGAVFCIESGCVEFLDQYFKDGQIWSFRTGMAI
eukprot:TRINITY_DN29790_c0_g1_i2.p1 TRINITY_DN29790_c0_g1~~TRINITY_DN29790_c0_g1_i2.p1  ORF type:complete len:338 (-),score=46.57 TRINITY_DN29790_c0_g1_i2:192-1205(-)